MGNKISIKGEHCPVARTLHIIGDKWTILILRDLFMQGPRRFQDFITSLEGISPNILSGRIKKLIELKIVESKLYSEHPPRNEYHLTKLGQSLRQSLEALRDWGKAHTSA